MRDNECRGARHKSRSDLCLMSVAIQSMHSRYKQHRELTEITPASAASLSDGISVHSIVFRAEQCGNHGFLNFNPNELVQNRGSWPSTRPDRFETGQCMLFKVLGVPARLDPNIVELPIKPNQ